MRLGLWDSLRSFFSHRTHRFNRTLSAQFRTHRRPPAYRYHRAFQLKVAVKFCEIGWLNVSVECCVFCSSVFFCEKKNNCETRWGDFSLTELTDLTDPFCAQFRSHRTPPAYRYHRTFQLTSAITFCDICRLLAGVCGFPLFAERPLFICENLWEIEYTTNQDVRWKASVPLWNSVRDETSNEPYSRQNSL